jgi:hypothetical protein
LGAEAVRVVVSDTSPVRALAHLGRLDLLSRLFEEVLIPPAVALRNPKSGLVAVEPTSVPGMRLAPDDEVVRRLLEELDAGEAEAIALALQLHIPSILIDERDGNVVARRLGLQPIGALALLLRAKSSGAVAEIQPLLDRLRTELGFHMTDELQARGTSTRG